MTISYSRTLIAGGAAVAIFAIAGGTLLGLGFAGGHTWQVIAGGSLLGVGVVGGIAFMGYTHRLRDEERVKVTFTTDQKTRIWAFASQNGQKVIITKNSTSHILDFVQSCG